MKIALRVLFILTALLGLTAAAAFFQKERLLEFVLKQYAARNGVRLAVTVKELAGHRLLLKDVYLGEKTRIPEIDIEFFSIFGLSVKSVRADLAKIDFTDLPQDRATDESAAISYFEAAQSACRRIHPLALDLSLGELHMNGVDTKFDLYLKKAAESPILQFERRTDERHQQLADLQMDCGEKEVSLRMKEMPVKNIPYTLPSQGYAIAGETQIKRLEFLLTEKNSVQARLLLTGLSLQGTYPVQASEVSLQLISQEPPKPEGHGSFYFRGLTVRDEKNQKLVEELRGDGTLRLSTDRQVRILFTVKNKDGQALSPETQVDYSVEKNRAKVTFFKKPVRIASSIRQSLPALKQWIDGIEGEYSLSGSLNYSTQKIVADLLVESTLRKLKTETTEISGLKAGYRIGPSMDTGSGRLSAESIDSAARLENLQADFQLVNRNTLKIQKLSMLLEGSKLTLSPFGLDIEQMTSTQSQLKMEKLSLEQTLQIFLKETVRAEGVLSGGALFYLKKGLPVIAKGELRAVKPGWIRYRPPGALPPPAKETLASTATPIEILNHYLYDFYFQTLEMDFSTDEDLVLNMTLRAFGNNPPYRQGQALKLNINLQENLLPVVKSVLLTQQLPEKLKKKMQKLGN